MIEGETIASGAAATCSECGVAPPLAVYSTPAGYYIGTYCKCGPMGRESDYFKNRKLAEEALAQWNSDTAAPIGMRNG